jgi:hypothetical protein
MSHDRLNRLRQKIVAELKKLFWVFLYLFVWLALFAAHESLVLNERHLLFHEGFALINAWLLAKVVVVAEAFHVADNLKHKPLIYAISVKSAVFSVLLIAFYILEGVLVGLWRGETLAESVPAIGGGTFRGIFVVGLIVFVALIPFFALRELGRDIGNDALREKLLGRPRLARNGSSGAKRS